MDTTTTVERGVQAIREEIERLGGTRIVDRREAHKRFIEFVAPNGLKYKATSRAKRVGTWQTSITYGKPTSADRDERSFWVFVDLGCQPPKFYPVPEWWISNDIHRAHQEYLRRHGGHRAVTADSQHHEIRADRIEQWEGRWSQLGLPDVNPVRGNAEQPDRGATHPDAGARPRVNREAVLSALRRFDTEFRISAEWANWEDNKAHKYAIKHEDTLYPVKKVVSLASGLPVSRFSGGVHAGHANRIVQQEGFDVVDLHPSNPDWTRDELILALNLYLQHRPNPPNKNSEEIAQLSQALQRVGLALFPASQRDATFRNANSVYMKLMNFRRLDPLYTAEGRRGLSRGAKGEEEVWMQFAGDPERCKETADRIIRAATDPEVLRVTVDTEDDIEEAPEGRLLTRMHLARERNRKLVESKRKRAVTKHGRLVCEVCGFDFASRYGARGEGFIECHHVKPVSTLGEGQQTHIADLALVCSNCHRMIHRGKPWLTVAELRSVLAGTDGVSRRTPPQP